MTKTLNIRAAFVVGSKTFDNKRDAEIWAAAVPKIKACEAYRFIKHLSVQTCGPRPVVKSTEDSAPHGIWMRFADGSSFAISIDGKIRAFANVSHQMTGADGEVHGFSSCCFLSDGKWEV